MKGEFICVVCPNGCTIDAEFSAKPPSLISAEGYACDRGLSWIRQEIENPMRTIASSVLVRNGNFLAASVRTRTPIPLEKVRDVMEEIRGHRIDAPVRIGEVLIPDVAGTGVDIIATRDVERVEPRAV